MIILTTQILSKLKSFQSKIRLDDEKSIEQLTHLFNDLNKYKETLVKVIKK